jgi:hypothetical protein
VTVPSSCVPRPLYLETEIARYIVAEPKESYAKHFMDWYRPRKAAQAIFGLLCSDRLMTQTVFRSRFKQTYDVVFGHMQERDLSHELTVRSLLVVTHIGAHAFLAFARQRPD